MVSKILLVMFVLISVNNAQAGTRCIKAVMEIEQASQNPIIPEREIAHEDKFLTSMGFDLHGQAFLAARPFTLDSQIPRGFVVPIAWATATPPTEISPSDLARDLDYLKHVLKFQYSGWETAQKRGWDWDRFFNRWKDYLNSLGTVKISVSKAFQPWRELQKFQPDNHTGARATADYRGRSATVLLKEIPHGPITQLVTKSGERIKLDISNSATQPRKAFLGKTSSDFQKMKEGLILSYPRPLGSIVAAVSNDQEIPLISDFDPTGGKRNKAIAALAQADPALASYRKLAPQIGYLRMPRMMSIEEGSYIELAKKINTLSDGKEKVLVIDLRGNLGGFLFTDVLMRWISPQKFQDTASKVIYKDTDKISYLKPALEWTFEASKSRSFENMNEGARHRLDSIFSDLMAQKASSVLPDPTFTVSEVPDAGIPNQRIIDLKANPDQPLFLVLIDHLTASNGENLAGILSQLPNTLLAGVYSFGVGEFGGAVTLLLPNTRVPFQIATNHNEIFLDHRSFDGYGINPDILLHTEKTNSPEYILELAQSLAHKR